MEGGCCASATNCASQLTLFPTFLLSVPLLVVIWSYTQDKATTRQPGILCGWSGRLEQSATGYSFSTYIINVQKHAQDTSVLSFLLHWLTVSRVWAENIGRRFFSNSSHVTAPYRLSFYYYYYYYYYDKTTLLLLILLLLTTTTKNSLLSTRKHCN